jgi:hypothetical protein
MLWRALHNVEIECFLPQRAISDLGVIVGSYHHGHPLPPAFPAGWTAEHDSGLYTSRQGYVALEIVSPVLRGRAGIEQVKQVAEALKSLGACVNHTAGVHVHCSAEKVAGPSFALLEIRGPAPAAAIRPKTSSLTPWGNRPHAGEVFPIADVSRVGHGV